MNAELHLVVFDATTAARRGGTVEAGLNVHGCSPEQVDALVKLTERTLTRMKEYQTEMRKTGTAPDQAVTEAEGDGTKTAGSDDDGWTTKDAAELVVENTEADGPPA